MRQLLLTVLFILAFTRQVNADQGIDIYAAEIGVAKFHRYDNKERNYGAENFWSRFIMPDKNRGDLLETLFWEHGDGAISIVFTNLEDLLVTAARQAELRGKKIRSLNINTHGLPGGLWFPMDQIELQSTACLQWVTAAKAKDVVNYEQYYSPLGKSEILALRELSEKPRDYGCVTGPKAWETVVNRHPEIKFSFIKGAQINFFACLVGLGKAGEKFSATVAKLLLANSDGQVKSSIHFGLGDWSMPEGMGFWDYIDDAQLNHFNKLYPVYKTDRNFMQKGILRITTLNQNQVIQDLVTEQNFMSLLPVNLKNAKRVFTDKINQMMDMETPAPAMVRVPGTQAIVY